MTYDDEIMACTMMIDGGDVPVGSFGSVAVIYNSME